LKASVESEALNRSAEQLEKMISVVEDKDLLAKVSAKAHQRIEQKNEAYDELVSGYQTFFDRLAICSPFFLLSVATSTSLTRSRSFDSLEVLTSRYTSPASSRSTRSTSKTGRRCLHGSTIDL
jgi:hypothetical protein